MGNRLFEGPSSGVTQYARQPQRRLVGVVVLTVDEHLDVFGQKLPYARDHLHVPVDVAARTDLRSLNASLEHGRQEFDVPLGALEQRRLAGCVEVDPVALSTEQVGDRRAEDLPPYVPKSDVDGRDRLDQKSPGTERRIEARAELSDQLLERHRVAADEKPLDGLFEESLQREGITVSVTVTGLPPPGHSLVCFDPDHRERPTKRWDIVGRVARWDHGDRRDLHQNHLSLRPVSLRPVMTGASLRPR